MYDSKGKGFYMKPIIYGATMDDFFKGRWEWTDGGLGGTRFAILETIREFYRSSGKDIPIYIEYRHSHIKGFPMLEKLIEMGLNVNYIDDNGMTVLMYCAEENMVDYAKLLINNNADVSIMTPEGKNAKQIAKEMSSNEVLELLGGK